MPQDYIRKILAARVYDVAVETPVDEARLMSRRLGHTVLLKREDLQPVFSFKLRGAYNKLASLSPEALKQGVICASAGNHAQGVALGAAALGAPATIVMPRTTPRIKVDAVRNRGGKVVLHGDTYDEAALEAQRLATEKSLTFVHPYDDPEVIAGQGTVGVEILRQVTGKLDAVFVPVGGGGLLAGIAAYIRFVRPDVKIIGVEPEDAACLDAALKAKRRVKLKEVGIFADGVAVAQIGQETFRLIRDTVDEVITASTDEICAAIKDIFEDTRSIAEPAGALALAGLKKYAARLGADADKQTLLAVCSGANTNFDRLRYISERTEIGERREAVFCVGIPEKPGSFRQFCNALGRHNITEFNYRYADAAEARIFVGLQISPEGNDRDTLIEHLRSKGFSVTDMTDNEMAKLHTRHMVGGRAPVSNEVVYHFEFPERPGALMNFLNQLGGRWNISMFHYRNHGSAYGRVLAGLEVPPAERRAFRDFLNGLGYGYREETDNPAYRLFLR